jgi:hypothetical protein
VSPRRRLGRSHAVGVEARDLREARRRGLARSSGREPRLSALPRVRHDHRPPRNPPSCFWARPAQLGGNPRLAPIPTWRPPQRTILLDVQNRLVRQLVRSAEPAD